MCVCSLAEAVAGFAMALSPVTAFNNMLRHINCMGIMSMQDWEDYFGTVSQAFPYGNNFWAGFTFYMITIFQPAMVTRRYLGGIRPFWCWFDMPAVFCKENARQPQSAANGGTGEYYPCFAWPTDCSDLFYMVCINICLKKTAPWVVHRTWITFLDAPNLVFVDSPLGGAPRADMAYMFSSTVTIEEVESDEEVEV